MQEPSSPDVKFSGSIPEMYERVLVPLMFGHYAADLALRVGNLEVEHLLEIAAGTGAVTRELDARLDESVSIVATDLHQAMLDLAASRPHSPRVTWRAADAYELPFPDASFDVAVCQFGVMFFPDKARAFSEIRRVLRPGGVFLFNVWDGIEANEFAGAVTDALAGVFPDDRPTFIVDVPHGYHDATKIRSDLHDGGFTDAVEVEAVEYLSRAASAEIVARGFCEGTPIRNEIVARDPARLGDATRAAAALIASRFGTNDISARTRAFVVTTRKPR